MDNISKFTSSKIKRLLKAYPDDLSKKYVESRGILETKLPEEVLSQWENIGLEIAQLSSRSWEPSISYFSSSIKVQQYLPSGQFLGWCKSSFNLAKESNKVAEYFLNASPQAMVRLRPRYIEDWVTRVTKLHKGTWKSTNLTCKLFEYTPIILETLSFDQFCKLLDFMELLSNRSYDLANEILDSSIEIFSLNFQEIDELIHLSVLITENEWRDIKPTYEIIRNQVTKLPNAHTKITFDMTRRLHGLAGLKISAFLQLLIRTLSLTNKNDNDQILQMTQQVVNNVPVSILDFLNNIPRLLDTLDIDQLYQWKSQGIRLAIDQDTNTASASQFFKLQSKESKDLIDKISSSVELSRIKDLMKLYCTALSGEDVLVSGSKNITEKNIGWGESDLATSDGKTIYLPDVIKRYNKKEENFNFYKVLASHQQALTEYGSYKYDYKLEPINTKSKAIFKALLDQVNESDEEHATRIARILRGSSPFKHDPKLADDIFSIVEEYRVDQLILKKYPGLRKFYTKVQLEELNNRKNKEETNKKRREVFIEKVLRFTLGDKDRHVPKGTKSKFEDIVRFLLTLSRISDNKIKTVEDSMAVSFRLFSLIRDIDNNEIDSNEEEEEADEIKDEELDDTEDQFEDEQIVNDMISYFSGGEGESEPGDASEESSINPPDEGDYQSPDPVEYQGDFKPELGQLLTEMLTVSGDEMQGEGEEMEGLTQEQIEELVQNSPDLETKESD
ncbi:MAG: hypothetical protein VX523_02815, partial [Chloroflexota bacterium]|nr:hypothetical protein [Chloroflexota bacterium]